MKAALLVLLTLSCALALPACGPGLTGTGTGSAVGLQAYNATEQAVCGAPFANTLGCPGSTGAGAPQPLGGVRHFEGGSGAGLVRARFEGNELQITAPCTGFSFEGVWGRSAALGDRFYGAQVLDSGRTLLPASVVVFSVSADLQITVQNQQSSNLLGPVTLQPRPAAPGVAACS
jgi:hypothetical protein